MLVNLKTKNIINHQNAFILKPGPNQVNSEVWKEARKHPTIQRKIEAGHIVEEQADAKGKLPEKVDENDDFNHLQKLKPAEAKALVNETVDVELLKAWHKVERRNQVIGAINLQLKTLGAPPEIRDRSQPRQVVTNRAVPVEHVAVKPNASDD